MEDKGEAGGERTMEKKAGEDEVSAIPLAQKIPMTFKALISLAILSSPIKKATLAEIYKFIEDAFAEFTKSRSGWKNTVRHNLSIHECFVKGDLAPPGKSCYWKIHENYVESFSRGDFTRRLVKIANKEKRCLTGEEHGTRARNIRRKCYDIPLRTAPRLQPVQSDRDDYLVYSAWRRSEEERKRFIAEVSPFCKRYCCTGEQLCVSLPHVVGYDQYVLPTRSFHCACKDCHE